MYPKALRQRQLFRQGECPSQIANAIKVSYVDLSKCYQTNEVKVAVRSSATTNKFKRSKHN